MAVSPAQRAPAHVFAVPGEGGRQRLEALLLHSGVTLTASPRHASLLLVAGVVPERAHAALRRLHDQVPHPRAVVAWDAGHTPFDSIDVFSADPAEDPAAASRLAQRLAALQAGLMNGSRPSSPALLPDEPPSPWRGEGDHGQGGEGMMGGKPYGRPMPMTGPDLRDGLSLDAYPVTIGPFAPMLPAGLEIALTLQGDVIQHAEVRHAPFPDPAALAPFREACGRTASPARLERLRAAHHLRSLARLVRLRGLPAVALRLLLAARRLDAGQTVNVAHLARRVRLSGLLWGIERGTGAFGSRGAQGLAGPARRAAGADDDLRSAQIPYTRAAFQPVIHSGGDTVSRIRQWLAEAVQAAALAERMGDREVEWPDAVESPAGPVSVGEPPTHPLADETFPRLLAGLEWGQAVAALASFDVNTLQALPGGRPS